MLRFFAALPDPDRLTEVSRVQTSTTHARQIVDILCRGLNYYPSKPK
jgi:hypothetical protein